VWKGPGGGTLDGGCGGVHGGHGDEAKAAAGAHVAADGTRIQHLFAGMASAMFPQLSPL